MLNDNLEQAYNYVRNLIAAGWDGREAIINAAIKYGVTGRALIQYSDDEKGGVL